MSNPNHIPQDHPVARLLRGAANSGQALSPSDLGSLDDAAQHVPGGASFAGFKGDISSASQRIAALKAEGRNGAARELADETTAQLAGRMTDGQRATTAATIQRDQDSARDAADIDGMVRRALSNGY